MIIEREPRSQPEPSPKGGGARLDRLFLYQRGELSFDQMMSFRGGPRRRKGHQLILWSWLALVIDFLILMSLSCLFVLLFAALVRSPVSHLVKGFSGVSVAQAFAVVFIASAWAYMVSLRIFFGFSVGEWACDLRLGQPSQRLRATYPLRVIARTTLVFATGVALLPLMSLVSGRDWAGRLCGLQLISLK